VIPTSVIGPKPGASVPSVPEAPVWFANSIQPSVWPSVTVEIITD
jgi:hypothetical protein